MSSPALAWPGPAQLAECPVWDDTAQRLWFVDILGHRLHALDAATHVAHAWPLPEPVCSLCLATGGALLLALARRVALFDPGTGTLRTLATPDMPEGVRLNDGKLGPDGAFWVSGMHGLRPHRPLARLWRVTADGCMEPRLDGLRIGNGLAWSPDGRTMYLSDSGAPPGWIDAWRFDPATGAMADRRRFATPAAAEGLPDGACCDADGTYWSAGNGGGRINRYSADGKPLPPLHLPVPTPTMPCLGGGSLWITSMRHRAPAETLRAYPAMGGVFRVAVPAIAQPAGRFAAAG